VRGALLAVPAAVALSSPVRASASSESAYPQAPAESKAVTVVAKGDGRADDTDALQAAHER
jgi:hypothetical protein